MGESGAMVGCCGWSEAQARYVRDFPVIEIQTTFYQPPDASVAKRWKSQAPPGFQFCMKAWQLITHTPASPTYRRLKAGISPEERELYGSFRPTEQVWLAWERTRDIASILDARVVVFQCPKSFLPTPESMRNLSRFFNEVDRDGRTFGWEPRGDDWNPGLIRDLCVQCNLVHIVDPFQSDAAYGDALYWRLHGRQGYRYRYTDEDLAELEAKLQARAHLPGPNYVMFNNIYSKDDALRFTNKLDAWP
ncbi:MAG TPA: DUF72 domain-containing protein [Bryobacteraceae bacterium]|nr:DUF72 domain-containing protein [Bryobacteraceae bacterium]